MKQYQVEIDRCEFDFYLFPYTDEGASQMEDFVYTHLDNRFGDLTDIGDYLPIRITVVDCDEPEYE